VYIPPLFAARDQSAVFDVMEQFSFATLVTNGPDGLTASHLPFLLDRAAGEHGTLLAHMARANPQWQAFADDVEALVIFQGEHGYISPAWYEVHPSVPTWNYVVAHAYGVPRVMEQPDRVRRVLEALVSQHESGRDEPWAMNLPEEYYAGMVKGIVAFEIPISRLEGKLKLSQNRPLVDQKHVLERLAASSDANKHAMASRMKHALENAQEDGSDATLPRHCQPITEQHDR
jgi:transcriptional regulator